jgi:hypothetical protein
MLVSMILPPFCSSQERGPKTDDPVFVDISSYEGTDEWRVRSC